MKNHFPLLLNLCLALALSGCGEEMGEPGPDQPTGETEYEPILINKSDLASSVKFMSAQPLRNPAKIYRYGDYLFINELSEGVHVVFNANPAQPINLAFIAIPGCHDMAVEGAKLYANNSVDLLTIDMSDPSAPEVVGRIQDIFPEPLPPDLDFIPSAYDKSNRPAGTIILSWVKAD